ncbi:sulfhydryl oxidase 2-like [Saccoglossus kowalevskii]|uniref:Sulfhydryl oxidase n=1 Tax=Saccoglossus kowalevskii TaxID=10224 RepID=A0ABM0MH54_SACKO|nr:PREDICTED: sulfhydryl oxidase 2-like [Saccoglossus kowalevskii]
MADFHNMSMLSIVLFLFLLNSVLNQTLSKSIIESPFYNSSHHITVLDSENIRELIYNKPNAWIIEFYSSWCGHCIRFAPTWRQLANDIQDWHDVINIAAMDCSLEPNLHVCRDYDIGGYPTIKFFNTFITKNITGIKHSGSRMVVDFRHEIVDFVEKHDNKPSHWPDFTSPTLDFILRYYSSKQSKETVQYLVVIFEDSTSYIGRQVILDMMKYDNLVIRRVVKETANDDVIKKFEVQSFPAMYLYFPNQTYHRFDIKEADRKHFRESLIDFEKRINFKLDPNLEGQGAAMGHDDSYPNQAERLNLQKEQEYDDFDKSDEDEAVGLAALKNLKYVKKYSPVYMQDLESTLHYSFRHEIPMHSILQGEKLDAVKKFVDVLAKFFPGRSQITSYLEELNYWLEDNDSSQITSDDWLEYVNEKYDPEKSPDTYLPSRLKWVGCQGSQDRYRGYPCGLWILFHTLTVSAATTNKDYTYEEKLQVLHAMRGYIVQFFGCRECATNFDKMAVTIKSTVATPDEALLWLWRAHNQANKRLHNDPSEDPKHPKIQFPPSDHCPSCREYAEDEWKQNEVLGFLKEYYHQKNIALQRLSRIADRQVDVRHNPKFLDREYRQEMRQEFINDRLETVQDRHVKMGLWGLGINGMDMSMCLLLYSFCVALVLLLYVIFCKRRRRKHLKHII